MPLHKNWKGSIVFPGRLSISFPFIPMGTYTTMKRCMHNKKYSLNMLYCLVLLLSILNFSNEYKWVAEKLILVGIAFCIIKKTSFICNLEYSPNVRRQCTYTVQLTCLVWKQQLPTYLYVCVLEKVLIAPMTHLAQHMRSNGIQSVPKANKRPRVFPHFFCLGWHIYYFASAVCNISK